MTSPIVWNVFTDQPDYVHGAATSGVNSITAINGISADFSTGDVTLSGVNATTSSVGVASFNPADFVVNGSGEVSALSSGFLPWSDESSSFYAVANNGYFCTAPLTVTLPLIAYQGQIINVAVDFVTSPGNSVIVLANTGQTIRTSNMDTSSGGTAINTAQGDALSLVYRALSNEWFSLSTEGSWILS